ncbi:hypothetical protein QR680_008902 [Steinernema hermaphroditum]|uniref:G-protein coupled receptors family 1 profile domain-containing protein n=1 Tax=Steinernema hermaphroditum TaxID=289476 RepID=A0AA39M8X5_9BILA|nr:hypothetical protein QR680_008902 [Steinernema hermaphroditum]
MSHQVERFAAYFENYFLLVTSVSSILASSTCCIVYYRRRQEGRITSMFFLFFLVQIVYAVLSIQRPLMILCSRDSLEEGTLRWDLISRPLGHQIILTTGTFLAVDRVMVMAFPMKYGIQKIGTKVFFLCAALDLLICIIYSYFTFSTAFIRSLTMHYVMTKNVFPATLTVESLVYILFCIQLFRYSRSRNAIKQRTSQVNTITFFQVICHSIFCAVPHALSSLNSHYIGLKMNWISYVDPFLPMLFSTSVVLSSSFTLVKLRPRRTLVRVTRSFATVTN